MPSIMLYFHSILRIKFIGVSFVIKCVKWHHTLCNCVINVLNLIGIKFHPLAIIKVISDISSHVFVLTDCIP